MTTYFRQHMYCPDCGQDFSYMAVGSYNTFGATFYTDGYVGGPMYVDEGRLFACPGCSRLGWNDEYSCKEEQELDEEDFGLPLTVDPIPTADYPSLLRDKPWRNPNEEKYVRTRAFWATNSSRREQPETSSPLSEGQLTNAQALIGLLNESPQERLMHAELLRELGSFQECLTKLEGIDDPQLMGYCVLIRELAMERNDSVMPVSNDE